eukprot:TRINITY_DN2955_c1_g3_i1.p3 TRINITY_DN2955_c1_g3~~TRINITY_DN2955_c1_g3_i1.p3  ORF type:complete len:170 (-),score=10.33 TRINITY_DN2955_c1_g3_i1:644-1096(-)
MTRREIIRVCSKQKNLRVLTQEWLQSYILLLKSGYFGNLFEETLWQFCDELDWFLDDQNLLPQGNFRDDASSTSCQIEFQNVAGISEQFKENVQSIEERVSSMLVFWTEPNKMVNKFQLLKKIVGIQQDIIKAYQILLCRVGFIENGQGC